MPASPPAKKWFIILNALEDTAKTQIIIIIYYSRTTNSASSFIFQYNTEELQWFSFPPNYLDGFTHDWHRKQILFVF